MIRKLLTPLMAVTLLIWVAGCSETPNEPAKETLNLEDEFGGYTATPESPGFGDSDLLVESASDGQFEDEILTSAVLDSVISNPQSGYYHIRIVWGRLRYDSTVTEVTDWTGSLSVSRGIEIIRRVIRFEPGQDWIVRPRTSPQVIEWVSQTTVHNDGIAVDIFVPPAKPVFDSSKVIVVDSLGDTSYVFAVDTIHSEPIPVTISFETEPFSHAFKLEELKSLDTVFYLDDSNAVTFQAFELHRYPCPRGFVAGKWGYDENGQGRFRGVWWSQRPNLHGWFISGYLGGHFGQNQAGLNVFFGKWISASGLFEGFLKGTYSQHPSFGNHPMDFRNAQGWFAGRIYGQDGDEIGLLKGRYSSAPASEDGFFCGRWKLHCNSTEPDPSDSEEGF